MWSPNQQHSWHRSTSMIEMSTSSAGDSSMRSSDFIDTVDTWSLVELDGRDPSSRATTMTAALTTATPAQDLDSPIWRSQSSQKLLDTVERSWFLESEGKSRNNKRHLIVHWGSLMCQPKWLNWMAIVFWMSSIVIGVAVLGWRTLPLAKENGGGNDHYATVLGKALRFFDIQKSGDIRVPTELRVRFEAPPWRGNFSAMLDGQIINNQTAPATDLSGGFYDAGDHLKVAFPGAFAMTLLSWSVIEYKSKFQAVGELEHAKHLLRWGTRYLLKTFNASKLDLIYCQVGFGGGPVPNDHYCWERPEDLDVFHDSHRSTLAVYSGADLAGEMAAALASASIVFKDQPPFALELLTGAEALFAFARQRLSLYVDDTGVPLSERALYNSTSFHDELIWGATWLYFATGNVTYLGEATVHANDSFNHGAWNPFGAFDWDNKLTGAQLLLSRLRMLQGPGYPYEQVLQQYHRDTNLVMCAYLPHSQTFNRTPGGLMLFNPKATQHLPAAANAAFLATLYADYLEAADVPVIQCGSTWFSRDALRKFSMSQVDYILGRNPRNMSYVVGHGEKFPLRPHHRAASIPITPRRFSCTQGWQFRDSKEPNPHLLEGAMVGGPDHLDRFNDTRGNSDQNEPTVAGNAGLVAALIAVTREGISVDERSIFSAVPAFGRVRDHPATPWTP